LKLFIDTSAFYALEDVDDRHNLEARAIQDCCRKERHTLFTTHHILDESVTLIGSRLHPRLAARFGRQLLSSRVVCIVRTDEELEQAALNIYDRLQDPRVSFTDCLSFAAMRALGITTAISRGRDSPSFPLDPFQRETF
jgi:predicted nucleic acid-binding protein